MFENASPNIGSLSTAIATWPTRHSNSAKSLKYSKRSAPGCFDRKPGKAAPCFGDARCLRRMLVSETPRRSGQERCPDQPSGSREFNQQSINETCFVIALMNGQALFGFTTADKNRRDLVDLTIDQRVPKMRLKLSEPLRAPPPVR